MRRNRFASRFYKVWQDCGRAAAPAEDTQSLDDLFAQVGLNDEAFEAAELLYAQTDFSYGLLERYRRPDARLDVGIERLHTEAAAVVDSTTHEPHVYHFHTDLVGAPLELTHQAGELAWAGKYSAWGKVEMGEDVARVPRVDQPLRYPEQYADENTGLHYNTFRFYDPDIGRFISQDPIGLVGGSNLYTYAPNPTGWMDPLGWLNFPIDSPDLFPVTGNQKNIVEITMQGSRGRDFSAAYKAAGIRPADAKTTLGTT